MLEDEGFEDIEYGLENPTRIYQPVNLKKVNQESTDYYDMVWVIYHEWDAERRCERDLMLAELLASQQGETGTIRGISKTLREKNLKPCGKQSVEFTVREIDELIKHRLKIMTITSE